MSLDRSTRGLQAFAQLIALTAPTVGHASSWATAVPVRGSALGEMKVTDTVPANEGSPTGPYVPSASLTCDPAYTGATWPPTVSELDVYYNTSTALGAPTPAFPGGEPLFEPLYEQGVWALNDANAMADVLELTGQNLYLADVGGDHWVPNPGTASAATHECNWLSLAALDDVLERRQSYGVDIKTGIFLGVGTTAADDWACDYYKHIGRARQEADLHGNMRVVYFDELWRTLYQPETNLWSSTAGAHWAAWNVEALWEHVHGNYPGPDIDVFGNISTDGANCPEKAVGTLGSADLELWSRMQAPAIPRYVVPSAILGMPADPAGAGSTDPFYDFSSGDVARVSWDVSPPPLPPTWQTTHPNWEVVVDFLYASSVGAGAPDQGLELELEVNFQPGSGGAVSLYQLDIYDVHRSRMCILSSAGTGAPLCGNAWVTGGMNLLEFDLATTQPTTSHGLDRMVYLWGARVQYIDTDTGQAFATTDLALADAAFNVGGSPGGAVYAQPNDFFLVSPWLDGVAIAQHRGSTSFDPDVFDRLVEHTCDFLHSGMGPYARGCIVDEAGAAFGNGATPSTAYNAYAPPDALSRMKSADRHGDGVISTYLPMAVENAGLNAGRFTGRANIDPTYDTMVYEARFTRTLVGETHEWAATVPAGCGGDYTVYRLVEAQAGAPVMWWHVDHLGFRIDEGQVNPSLPTSGSTTVIGVSSGDELVVGWESHGGGSSPSATNNVHFVVTPPAGCTQPFMWTPASSLEAPEVEDLYDCITGYYVDPTDPTLCP